MRMMIFIAAAAALSGGALGQNVTSPTAPSATPPVPTDPISATPAPRFPNRGAMMQACQADFVALCPGMTPGDGKLGPCIRANRAKLSATCQAAMRDGFGARRQPPVPPAATPSP